ncbi:MAG: hypothetical protein NPIRA02_17890 [Nitrospirales bacterium]|nr:MAG: hypothetical protein NPIRA02_17890 [Nitrospirales bacterium]
MLFGFSIAVHADVIVNERTLTAHLTDASLVAVMDQIARQTGIRIDVVDTTKYVNSMISDTFEDMPLEQGIERLLNGWNFGLSKDPVSGAVRTLMIVSHRTGIEEIGALAVPRQVDPNVPEGSDTSRAFEEEEAPPNFIDEEPYRSDDELLDAAPPEVRELITRMQKRDAVE